ncbi:hypothetical protein ACHQM5_020407 [Ranunculus cassubicifolius]
MGDNYSASSSSSALAPGFRFHPTDEELVIYYLKRKVCGKSFVVDAISEIDIYKFEPWDLPDRSRLKSRDLEWYFFSGLDKKYGNGWRTNRATDQGYWKTTGKDRAVRRGERTVGMKKTLVFHIGRAPTGERTNWVMHEYRLVDDQLSQAGVAQDAFVLCRVFRKSGPGPKNGEKYGAPFVEEEWEDCSDNLLNLKDECGNEGYYGLTPQLQQEEYQEDYTLSSIPQSDVLVGSDGSNNLENPAQEVPQNVFIGSSQNNGLVDEKFIVPEQYQMDHVPNENEFFALEDFLNPADDNENQVDVNELVYSDAPQFESLIANSSSDENNKNPFEMFDEYMNFFDAESDMLSFDPSQLSEVPDFTEEENKAVQPLASSPGGASSSSSSEEKPDISKIDGDVKYENGWDSSIAKQVSRMLGSFPAPTAYAAELPTSKIAALGQASASVHVTAGMIHISGMTVGGGDKIWAVGGKRNNSDHILMTMNLMTTASFEPSKAMSVIMRSGFYFMLLWVVVLSFSCKVGSYIYTR